MEQEESIPFSALIAGIMIHKRECSSLEVAIILGELEGKMGIVIDDENDNLENLSCCIEISPNYDFQLKNGLEYNTILDQNITVLNFLMIHTNCLILNFLDEYFEKLIINRDLLYDTSREKLKDKQNRKILVKKKNRENVGFFKKRMNLIGGLF